MNINEIKKLLKPLIKETVKEVLFESGVLSGIVAEVAKGMQGQVIQESKQTFKQPMSSGPTPDEVKRRKKELLDAIGKDAFKGVDIFEGVEKTRIPEQSQSTQGSPLAGLAPDDSGVDISGIVALGGKNWNALVKGKKG
jgi:hypothetical protein